MRQRTSRLINALMVVVSLSAAFGVCELVFRRRYAHYFYAPRDEVAAIQSQLVLHPMLGFTWRGGIERSAGVVLKSQDVAFEPLSTDADGFLNHPEAIAQRKRGEPIDVIGLGDSFIEHGCHAFYERFREAGLFYYNMAIHRQSPPQYNLVLEQYAAPCKPAWIVYGLFENDFVESEDFLNWRESGLDWFAYHSGTWCGPPVGGDAWKRFLRKHLRGTIAFTRVLKEKLDASAPNVADAPLPKPDVVCRYIREAHDFAGVHAIQFLLVVIPSKATTLEGPTAESVRCDELVEDLRETTIHVLDLRKLFSAAEKPDSLYYKVDGHWNTAGAVEAANAIIKHVRNRAD